MVKNIKNIKEVIPNYNTDIVIDGKGNDGYISIKEGEMLIRLGLSIEGDNKKIFEFGTANGSTTAVLARYFEQVYSIDFYKELSQFVAPSQLNEVPALENVGIHARAYPNVHQLYGDTLAKDTRLVLMTLTRMFDMVFIDAGHNYFACLSDSLLALALVRPGGLIVWHDYKDQDVGKDVIRVVDVISGIVNNIYHIEDTWFAFCIMPDISNTATINPDTVTPQQANGTVVPRVIRHIGNTTITGAASPNRPQPKQSISTKRKLILEQKQCPGDVLVMTRALGDLKMTYPNWEIDTKTFCPPIFENSPRITKLDPNGPDVETYEMQYPGIHKSGASGLHFADCFREDMENKLNSIPEMVAIYGMTKINSTGIRPEIFISDDEKQMPTQVKEAFSTDAPYWILNAGHKDDCPVKQYPYWEEVVKCFNDKFMGKLNLVQVGSIENTHKHPTLDGALNLLGQTTHRQLIRLAYNAHGTIGPISYQYHLAGAFAQPSVLVLGGREGPRFTFYPWTSCLHTVGMLNCCKMDGCWVKNCPHMIEHNGKQSQRCFTLISPEEIVHTIEKYYLGGKLNM